MHLSGRRNNVLLMQNDRPIQEVESTAADVKREAMKPVFPERRFCPGPQSMRLTGAETSAETQRAVGEDGAGLPGDFEPGHLQLYNPVFGRMIDDVFVR